MEKKREKRKNGCVPSDMYNLHVGRIEYRCVHEATCQYSEERGLRQKPLVEC